MNAARSKKKAFLFIPLGILLIYFIWLGFLLLTFRTYQGPSQAFPLEAEGVYHIHSKLSDGWGTVDKIVRAGSGNRLDFLILTDHGNPNLQSLASQGWKEGVLILAGSELSVSRGHLVALDFRLPSQPFSQNTENAVHEITALGGFTIIAHPYSKVKWSWGEYVGYSGLEIINGDSMLRSNLSHALPYFPALLLKPEFVLLKMLSNPSSFLARWDERNARFPLYGYFGTDAHLFYRPAFTLLHLHLLLQKPLSRDFETAKNQVFSALRSGRFYNAIDAAARAKGFGFAAKKGNRTSPMGETVRLDSPVRLEVQAPYSFKLEIDLICNGKKITSSRAKTLSYETTMPGIYRVEVFLRERSPLDKGVPWIVSNPIFLKEETR
jgi:hypothetical protein